MIPNIGGSSVGPLVVLIGSVLAYGLLCPLLWWTVLRDRPQLRTRRAAAVGVLAGGLMLSAAALWLPYEGPDRRRCAPALPTYGFRTEALATGSSDDECAFPGQLLVTVGWTTPVMILMVAGIAWFLREEST